MTLFSKTPGILLVLSLLSACSVIQSSKEIAAPDAKKKLLEFAQANCLLWYFKNKGYNIDDIQAISAGYVELGGVSIDKFQKIALFVKDYAPDIKSKNNIDVQLNKCFHLEQSDELMELINN
jgi:hypothetical protein